LYVLDDNEVIIKDIRTKKCAYFTGARWKRLVSEIDTIDKHVECAMVGKTTAYHQHIGGTWHISVDNNYPTVDIRQWYETFDVGTPLKPTRIGIALTYNNWDNLKRAAVRVAETIPGLTAISHCWHDSQIQQMLCSECTPYTGITEVSLLKAAEAAENLIGDVGDGATQQRRKAPKQQHPIFSAIDDDDQHDCCC